jgi:hypothetical protein
MKREYNEQIENTGHKGNEQKVATESMNLHPLWGSKKEGAEGLKKEGFTDVILLLSDKNVKSKYGGQKMITKTDIGTNGTHYCKIRTESFSYEGQIVSIRTSDKGGYKKDGTKASGCTSQLSAESSALNSLINKISDSLNLRNSVSGEWIILKQWLIQNPDRYEQLQTEIRKHIAWAEFENGYSRNGIISHTAMNGALKAVFA